MITPKSPVVHPAIEKTRQQFELWRRTRRRGSPRSPIPEKLWALAVRLAEAHGINPTALALRLNYTALKQRVNAADSAIHRHRSQTSSSETSRPSRSATFVEITPSVASFSICTLELENAQGAKLKIQLPRLETADLLALSRSLWREEG
jgi:hypothetical protein